MDQPSSTNPSLRSSPEGNDASSTTSLANQSTGPPIRFSAKNIPNIAEDYVELVVRRFYSDEEWQALDDYERAVIVTKGVEFRNQNRAVRTPSDNMDMVSPNPYATIDEDGLEVWPGPADDVKLTQEEKEAFQAIVTKAMHNRFAQRQWGDRFYHGKFKMRMVCVVSKTWNPYVPD